MGHAATVRAAAGLRREPALREAQQCREQRGRAERRQGTANAATPMTLRNGMPTTSRPSRAMMTVEPANTTAPPAVATASAALLRVHPARAGQCRDRMNSA